MIFQKILCNISYKQMQAYAHTHTHTHTHTQTHIHARFHKQTHTHRLIHLKQIHTKIHTMVIVEGNGIGVAISKPGHPCLCFISCLCPKLRHDSICVKYWSSTEPSIKKQVNPVEDIRISPWPVDMVEFRADMYVHRKQVDVKLLYNLVPRTAWVSWSLRQAEFRSSCSHSSSSNRSWGQDAVVGASGRQRAWAHRTPVEQLSRIRNKCCYNPEELGVNMLQSVPVSNSPLTHN